MAGYIGQRSVTLSTTVANAQDVTATDTTPEVTIINNTHEDTDGGREGKVIFKGQQSGGEESTLAEIEANHSGSADDEKANLIFKTNDGSDGSSPTERLRIDSDGNIKLKNGNTEIGSISLTGDNVILSSAVSDEDMIFKGNDGGSTIDALTLDMSEAGNATFNGTVAAADGSVTAPSIRGTDTNTGLFFPSGGVTAITRNGVEGCRMDSAGRFLVAATGEPSNSVAGVQLSNPLVTACRISSGSTSSGVTQLAFLNGNGVVGRVETNGTATLFATTSDYRLKENVTDISNGITRVKQLAPKRFNFIGDADTTVDGFLAHETATVVPESVSGKKDAVEVWKDGEELPDGVSVGDNKLDEDGNTIPEHQGIDQSKLVPLLTAALQEAIAKIETLETQNTTQATQIADLITRVTALEAE